MAGHRKRARKDCGRKRSRGQKRRGKRARALTPAERRRRRRERYANDRQFREKILASNRASYAANKDEILGRGRKRYEEDPDYRDKIDATKRRSADKCRKARNARARKRYADDPDYRERHRAARRGAPRSIWSGRRRGRAVQECQAVDFVDAVVPGRPPPGTHENRRAQKRGQDGLASAIFVGARRGDDGRKTRHRPLNSLPPARSTSRSAPRGRCWSRGNRCAPRGAAADASS